MSENVMLHEAIDAARQGQRNRARDLLTRLLRVDKSNPEYWLWMSSVVDSRKEQIYCLHSVLRLDPGNRAAQQGLILLGAARPDEWVKPVPPIRRQWQPKVEEEPKPTGLKAIWANPVLRTAAFAGIAIVVIGLVLGGVFGWGSARRRIAAVLPTNTPGPPPTFTSTPTFIPGTRSALAITPSPTFVGPTPLWMFLEATYTPTPVYVNTPHPINEAFRTAMRALERGDYPAALNFMRQASQVDPESADIQYYMGEINRLRGEYDLAIEDYTNSIEINPSFAPAYLGRARAHLALNPKANVSKDLRTAIEKDPNYGEAYLEETAFFLNQGDAEAALEDLKNLEDLLPESPIRYLYLGQAELMLGENEAALEDAQQAVELDLTSLSARLLLGQASLLNDKLSAAEEALNTYLTYETEQPAAWLALGEAYYRSGRNYSEGLAALNKALELDDKLGNAYLYRGLTSLELGHGQDAVNDLMTARRFDSNSFIVNLGLGRALLVADRVTQAYNQINATEKLAETDEELAQVYYWRAQALEANGNVQGAARDWQDLIDLPEDSVQPGWVATAQAHLEALITPTVETPTPEPTPTRTPTPSSRTTGTPATGTKTVTPTAGTSTPGTVTTTPQPTATPTRKPR